MTAYKKHKNALIVGVVMIVGLFFRLWHIDFGLPYYYHNDESEIVEPAITAVIEFRSIFVEKNFQKLVPQSYVYGTFTPYFLSPALLVYNNVLSNLNKSNLYLFSRTITAGFSLLIILAMGFIYNKLFKDKLGTVLSMTFVAVNWKLIVFSHFVNADIFLTTLLILSLVPIVLYNKKPSAKLAAISGCLFGFAVGTKITGLISLPVFIYIFLAKKDIKSTIIFLLSCVISYGVSNPFSIIYFNDFIDRVVKMKTQEGGMVFSSVNKNPFKYLFATSYIATPLIAFFSLLGTYIATKTKFNRHINIFMIGQVLIYLLFFSLSSRKADRWMLPILPIVILYGAYGISYFVKNNKKALGIAVLVLTFGSVLYFPSLLLTQFKTETPKASAYLWLKENTNKESKKLLIDEGLTPMHRLGNIDIYEFNVYESKGAHKENPPETSKYKYIIIASKTMLNFKKLPVKEKYPVYASRWESFERKLNDPNEFVLLKSFSLPKPNIITLSDMHVYQNMNL